LSSLVESRENNKKTQTDYNIALLSQEIRMLPDGHFAKAETRHQTSTTVGDTFDLAEG